MIAQRTSAFPVVCAAAEDLPFRDNEFDAAMAILSVHHWESPQKGLAEMKRVSGRQVVFTFDPDLQDSLWLVRDYLPQIVDFENGRALPVDVIAECLGADRIDPVAIPHDCTDGFQAAYWRRPEMYLRADVQATISTLAQLPEELVSAAMRLLRADLDSGVWADRYSDLLTQDSVDFGYRVIVAE
jgi:SAM-dependent methyltransferase